MFQVCKLEDLGFEEDGTTNPAGGYCRASFRPVSGVLEMGKAVNGLLAAWTVFCNNWRII
jgi:hypothetical protein